MNGLCGRSVISVAVVCSYRGLSEGMLFFLALSLAISLTVFGASHKHSVNLIHTI